MSLNPPSWLPGDVTVREAINDDLPALLALETSCFDADQRWGLAAWQGELRSGGLVLVAETYDIVAAASFQIGDATAELYRVMTAPQFRGLGLATLLLARGFAWASQSGATEMLLEVRQDNQARSLYADAGFAPFYERTNYYGPGQHALVMRKVLKGNGDE